MRLWPSIAVWGAVALAVVAGITSASGCGSASSSGATPPKASASTTAATSAKAFDPCAKSPPLTTTYKGILKHARCQQQAFLRMAEVAGDLGVQCEYCHEKRADDPSKFDYPKMTERKQMA